MNAANALYTALLSIIDNSVRSAPAVVMLGDHQVCLHAACRPSCGVTVCFDDDGAPVHGSGVDTSGEASTVAQAMYLHLQAKHSRLEIPNHI